MISTEVYSDEYANRAHTQSQVHCNEEILFRPVECKHKQHFSHEDWRVQYDRKYFVTKTFGPTT